MTKPLDMGVFLTGMLTGAHATRERHISQAKTVQAAIFNRWRLDNPWTWQRKHVVWFLAHEIKDTAPATRYYYQLTVSLIALRMGKSWFGKPIA
jgi:hypothetical protein